MTLTRRKTAKKAKKKSYRDLYEDGVTYSFLSQFHNCRESARLQYVEGWQSDGLSVPLDFGIAFHDCLEWTSKGHSSETINRPLKKYQVSKLSNSKLRLDERKKLKQVIDLVRIIFPLYAEYWASRDKDHKYVYQEESFHIPHSVPYYGKTKIVPVRGRIDEAFYRKSDNALVLQENKTKGQIDEDGIQSSLHMDLQTMMYSMALRHLTGSAPSEILYNVIRRPGLRPRQKETDQEFLKRVEEDVRGRPSFYFMRWQVELAPGDLDCWIDSTFNPILTQIIRWWDSIANDPFNPDSPEHYVDPEGLFGRYGKSNYFNAITRGNFKGLKKSDAFRRRSK